MIGYTIIDNKYIITIDNLQNYHTPADNREPTDIYCADKIKYFTNEFKIINIKDIFSKKNLEYLLSENNIWYEKNIIPKYEKQNYFGYNPPVECYYYLDETIAIYQSLPHDILLNKLLINMCGIHKDYYLDGSLYHEFYHNNGKINGEYKIYYSGDENKINKIINYVDGKKHGENITYDKNGVIIEKSLYNDDKIDGKHIIYQQNIITCKFYKNNEKIYEFTFPIKNEYNDINNKIIEYIDNILYK